MTDFQFRLDITRKIIIVRILRSLTRNYHEGLVESITTGLADGAERVVLDLDGVSFIDSSGITTLLKSKKAADVAGAKFAICNLSDTIFPVIKSLNLERVFNVKASLDEAMR